MCLVAQLLVFIGLTVTRIQGDPHHPHLSHHNSPPNNMTELCDRHKWFLEMNHHGHLVELKYRTCMSSIALDKFKKRENECFTIMDPKDIGYCMSPENYQTKFSQLKQCLDESMPSEMEAQRLKECMGFRSTDKIRRKRNVHWLITKLSNFSQVCDITMVGYYLNHPSHFEAHHICTSEVIGPERVGKRTACHAKYPIKSYDDFNEKCVSPEDHKEEFNQGIECFRQNVISPEEKASIMKCTFKALGELDKEYAMQALIYKPFKDFEEFCIKSRNYWHDEEEIYKDRFDACAMKVNPVKAEERWTCETFDKFDQTSVEKCIEKQEDEFQKMKGCLEKLPFTGEEEEKIKVCLAESQVEWKGVPQTPASMEDSCVYTLFRWFGFNPVYYKFVEECMKEKWSPQEYQSFECAGLLTIKSADELTEACKNPSEDHKATYAKFRECRETNEPPLEKIKDAFDCSMNKMIDHVNELKKEEPDADEA